MGFTVVNKKYILPNQYASVKAQLMIHCFANDIRVGENDLDCLTLMAIHGVNADTIRRVVSEGIFKSEQVVRNYMTKYKRLSLIVKLPESRLKIVNPEAAKVDNLIGIEVKMGNLQK